MRLVIAAQAALLILELDFAAYRKVGNIIVHPTTIVLQGERASASMSGLVTDDPMVDPRPGGPRRRPGGPGLGRDRAQRPPPRAGLQRGVPRVRPQARHARRRRRRHPAARDQELHDALAGGLHRAIRAIRAGARQPPLGDYAATDAGEFFAVVTEVFFDRGRELEADRPELYAVLSAFYRQDPAARERADG